MPSNSKVEKDPYPACNPHGELEKVAEDVYVVYGSWYLKPLIRIDNTMTVVKNGDEVIIINSVRVSKAVEEQIQKLGKIKHVVRLSGFHGAYDRYYVETFNCTLWDLPGKDRNITPNQRVLNEGGDFPIAGAKIFLVKGLKKDAKEAVVWIPQAGGTILCGDFLVNGRVAGHANFGGKALLWGTGCYCGHCSCVPFTQKLLSNNEEDMYQPNIPRILENDFSNVITPHGPAQMGDGKEDLIMGCQIIKPSPIWANGGVVSQ